MALVKYASPMDASPGAHGIVAVNGYRNRKRNEFVGSGLNEGIFGNIPRQQAIFYKVSLILILTITYNLYIIIS